MATFDQQTAPEIRAAFRERAGKAEYFPVLALHRDHVLALCADADALAGALKETARLRAVLEEIIELPTTPVGALGGVGESIIGMAVKAGRLEAAAIAARALTPPASGEG